MLKNLASLGAAGALHGKASRLVLDARTTPSLIQSISVTHHISRGAHSTPPDHNNAFSIDNRRHCMGPSIGSCELPDAVRKLPFTGTCSRLTIVKNASNPNISKTATVEVKKNRPTSCPHKPLASFMTWTLPANAEKSNSKNTLVQNFPATDLPDSNYYPKAAKPVRIAASSQTPSPIVAIPRVSSRGGEKVGQRGFSVKHVSKTKLSSRRKSKVDHSSSYLKKRSTKTPTEAAERLKAKTVSQSAAAAASKKASIIEKHLTKNTAILSQKTSFASRSKPTISNTKDVPTIDLRNVSTRTSPDIRSPPRRVPSIVKIQNSSTNIAIPHSRGTNSSKVIKRKQMMRPERSLGSINIDNSNHVSLTNKLSQHIGTKSSPKMFDETHNTTNTALDESGAYRKQFDAVDVSDPMWGIKKVSFKSFSIQPPLQATEKQVPNKPWSIKQRTVPTKIINKSENKPPQNTQTKALSPLDGRSKIHEALLNANKQISLMFKEKFDPCILDRFRYRKIAMTTYTEQRSPLRYMSQLCTQTANVERLTTRPFLSSSAAKSTSTTKNNFSVLKRPPLFQGRTDDIYDRRTVAITENRTRASSSQLPFTGSSLTSQQNKGPKVPLLTSKEKTERPASILPKLHASPKAGSPDSVSKAGSRSRTSGMGDGNQGRSGGGPSYTILRKVDSALYGTSATYLETLYQRWKDNPKDVDPSWDDLFQRVRNGTLAPTSRPLSAPATQAENCPKCVRVLSNKYSPAPATQKKLMQQMALQNIVHHYQENGHLQAEVDPLCRRGPALGTKFVKATDKLWPEAVTQLVRDYQMTDMNELYFIPLDTSIGKPNEEMLPLHEILNRLQDAYCRYIGIEFMHVPSAEKRKWVREQFEPGIPNLTSDEKIKLWKRLTYTAGFEKYLNRKWPTTFRFSIEGCEIFVPALQQILDRCVPYGTDHMVLGMAHRGRLNVMANILNKEIEKLLVHFKHDVQFDNHAGDVKYHLGCYITQKHEGTDKNVTICIVSNASHLESVNPVVQGRCKAEQIILNDHQGKKVLPIIVHGDAAYAGQGVVFEQNTFNSLPAYSVHGTIHLVINNNIGFTTPPEECRSASYCSDVAKLVHAPIFHVNSEKADEVMHCINVACDYRNLFHSDVVVDMVCYRRHGHNEADEPAFTSPIRASQIRARPPFPDMYTQQLLNENVISQKDVDEENKAYFERCEKAYHKSLKYTSIDWKDWNDSPWKDIATESIKELTPTGVLEDVLRNIARQSLVLPKGFVIHKALERIFRNRKKMIENRSVDWALGETLAFGTLLLEGVPVRLAGQDSQRGTFSHRHHVLHHQTKDNETYVSLNHLSDKQGRYSVVNSPLIEYGALAFETGFAMSFSKALNVFELQYGDFFNNGQLIFDAYLSCGESKWGRQCGLVVLSPHGLEGLGSEHSSGRLERFLQASCEETNMVSEMDKPGFAYNQLRNINWIVANCTTPANYFHILRRQIKLPFKKPLIMMNPKSLLRHPECKSSFDEMIGNTAFKSVIPDTGIASKTPNSVKRHILCSGKVFYDLQERRGKLHLESSIAITRVEQLCPFPFDYIFKEIKRYPAAEICWLQEEHKNQGAWTYVFERLNALLHGTNWFAISYIGRPVSAVPAAATVHKYNEEKEEFLVAAMTIADDSKQRGIKVDKFHTK